MENNIPSFPFNIKAIENTVFKGSGGKEKQIAALFDCKVERKNHSIYDFIINGERIECKRQTGGNWFDYAKFHNLTEEDGQIIVLFFNHKLGVINLIAGIRLLNFITLACSDERCIKDGWTLEAIEEAYNIKQKFPALEFKAPVHIPKIIKDHRENFKIFYEK